MFLNNIKLFYKLGHMTTRYATNKMKETETATTSLRGWGTYVKQRFKNHHGQDYGKRLKKWSYEDNKMTLETKKVNANTIMSYINIPLMESFGGKGNYRKTHC